MLVNFFKRKELYCNSHSLRQSLLNVTIFCPTGGKLNYFTNFMNGHENSYLCIDISFKKTIILYTYFLYTDNDHNC